MHSTDDPVGSRATGLIPGKIVRFLEQYANVAFAGTRDRDLVPSGHRVCGWRVGADQRTMTAFVPEEFTPGLVESLQENGELAVTVEEFPSHETYQFKGRYLRDRAVRDDDVEIVDRIRKRFVRSLRPMFADAPEDVLKRIRFEAIAGRRVRGARDLPADARTRRGNAPHPARGELRCA